MRCGARDSLATGSSGAGSASPTSVTQHHVAPTALMLVSAARLTPRQAVCVCVFFFVVWSVLKKKNQCVSPLVCLTLTRLSRRVCQLDKQTPLRITTRCRAEERGRRCAHVCARNAADSRLMLIPFCFRLRAERRDPRCSSGVTSSHRSRNLNF